MDFKLTEEQEILLKSLRETLKRAATEEYIAECDRNKEYPTKIAEALEANGFNKLGIPEEYGGTPCDVTTLMLVGEEICKFGAPSFLFGQALQIDDMLTFGNEEQIAQTMECVKQGQVAFSLGISEPGAGSDTNSIQTTFTRRNGKVYINGQKTYISNAMRAKYMMCMTRDPNVTDPAKAFTMWWVPSNAPGITMKPLNKLGWRGIDNCEVWLDNVEVEEKDILGKEGYGFMNLMKNFEIERLLMAASVLGMAECAFEDAARHANQRVQFGKRIGEFQQIQQKIVEMKIKIENMRARVYTCAWEKDNGLPVQISSALAKLYCGQAANQVIDDAVQILGGLGWMEDTRVARLWRDARVFRIGGGTDQVMIHIAGRALLKQYR